MQIKNTNTSYGLIAIFLHWFTAMLIIGMLILGLYMTDLPISYEKLKWYGWHKEYGLFILFIVTLRLIWRISNTLPSLTLSRLEKTAGYSMHLLLYLLMLAMPVTGWLLTSAAGLPFSFFGLFTAPMLIAPNAELRPLLVSIHHYLAYMLMAAILLHVSAALKHHFINKNDVLRRIFPL